MNSKYLKGGKKTLGRNGQFGRWRQIIVQRYVPN